MAEISPIKSHKRPYIEFLNTRLFHYREKGKIWPTLSKLFIATALIFWI